MAHWIAYSDSSLRSLATRYLLLRFLGPASSIARSGSPCVNVTVQRFFSNTGREVCSSKRGRAELPGRVDLRRARAPVRGLARGGPFGVRVDDESVVLGVGRVKGEVIGSEGGSKLGPSPG
jgi:hypothetical protein